MSRTGTGSRLGGEVRRKGGRRGLLSASLKSPGRELYILGPRLQRAQRNLVLVKPLGITSTRTKSPICVPFRGLQKIPTSTGMVGDSLNRTTATFVLAY